MGCFICNILEIASRVPYEKCIQCAKVGEVSATSLYIDASEVKEAICNDIAVCHPEMVKRIMEIFRLYCRGGRK